MIAQGVTPRNFLAHVEITAAHPTPARHSGLYDSVGQFLAVTGLYANLDAPFERFAPPQRLAQPQLHGRRRPPDRPQRPHHRPPLHPRHLHRRRRHPLPVHPLRRRRPRGRLGAVGTPADTA